MNITVSNSLIIFLFFIFQNLDFKAMILSAQFWPNLKEEKLSLHSKVQTQLDKYTKSYEVSLYRSFTVSSRQCRLYFNIIL